MSFRHPAKPDPRTNSGMKIRRGLGTNDDAEADRLVAQMNELLSEESWWSVTQRDAAARHFAPVVVSAFYDPLEPEAQDTSVIRDQYIPLPGSADGYTRVMFIGTTGAGKTTLLRHIIGSDPKKDRFPSTSTAKTTIADIEVVLAEGPYNAVVTFFDEWHIHTNVVECVLDAGLAVWERKTYEQVAERLLQHQDQKFRLSYVLGSWTPGLPDLSDDEWTIRSDNDASVQEPTQDDGALTSDERQSCQAFLEKIITRLRAFADTVIREMSVEFDEDVADPTGSDYEVYQDIFESELEARADFDHIVKDIMDEVRLRFSELTSGQLQRRKSGWPKSWHLDEQARDEFIRQIRWFSSNHARSYGRLLTPLVDGIRIRGPLYPDFADRQDRLVLIDGQGLGHTPDSSSSVTTHITSRFGSVNVILLVDSAAQPMQAAPLAAVRAILSSGHQKKLAIAFTHFDDVKGDSLPGPKEKRAHVMASVRNGIGSFKDMGQIAVSSLLRRIDERAYMFGYLDQSSTKLPRGFVGELNNLLDFFGRAIEPKEVIDLRPIYDMSGVAFAVREAADEFSNQWSGVLGLSSGHGYPKEHWTRIKALNRRFAQKSNVEYDSLRPVADLVKRLEEAILRFLEKPLDWSRRPKDEDEAEEVLSIIRQEVAAAVEDIAKARIADEHLMEWVEAYNRRGKGSTFVRARQVMDIYDAAAPVPGAVTDRISLDFLREVRGIVRKAILDNGGEIQNL
jgi:energy-coupling factor transporter ATP-binding protein EcfA2